MQMRQCRRLLEEIIFNNIFGSVWLSKQEGRHEDALLKFTQALQVQGFDPHLSYNAALCHFKLKEFASAQKYIGNFTYRLVFFLVYNNNNPRHSKYNRERNKGPSRAERWYGHRGHWSEECRQHPHPPRNCPRRGFQLKGSYWVPVEKLWVRVWKFTLNFNFGCANCSVI